MDTLFFYVVFFLRKYFGDSSPTLLKVHKCRFENLPISAFSNENNILKISLFEICTRTLCDKFVYKHSETIEYVKN